MSTAHSYAHPISKAARAYPSCYCGPLRTLSGTLLLLLLRAIAHIYIFTDCGLHWHMRIHTCTFTYTFTYACIYMCTYANKCRCVCTYIFVHICIRIHMCLFGQRDSPHRVILDRAQVRVQVPDALRLRSWAICLRFLLPQWQNEAHTHTHTTPGGRNGGMGRRRMSLVERPASGAKRKRAPNPSLKPFGAPPELQGSQLDLGARGGRASSAGPGLSNRLSCSSRSPEKR